MEKLQNFKGMGIPISFGEGKRQGTRGAAMYRVTETGEIERVSDYLVTDENLDEAIKKLSEL